MAQEENLGYLMFMESVAARFTQTYTAVVLIVSAALAAGVAFVLGPWTFRGMDTATMIINMAKLACLGLLLTALFVTQVIDLIRPQAILRLTPSGIHDRRLTRGPVLWTQVARILMYRKGWQWMVTLEPRHLGVLPANMALGPMPLYAFNRLCARWRKRPELNVGLGGLAMSSDDIMTYIRAHYTGDIVMAAPD